MRVRPIISSGTTEVLRNWEGKSPAHSYRFGGGENPLVEPHDAGGREVVVISDLHLAAGREEIGTYRGTENFFNDDAFVRFIDRMIGETSAAGGTLVINGDFIDFIRIVQLPESNREFEEWSRLLDDLGMASRTPESLRASIVDRERTYGLKTPDYKSVWRLYRSIAGHPDFFGALAAWLASGRNQLIVVKGNHDLEWAWKEVRDGLRLALAEMMEGGTLRERLAERVLPNVYFYDDALLLDDTLYIEHGHRYDRYTRVVGDAIRVFDRERDERELNIPFGSFFNRYLLNPLEGVYPFVDNIRPREKILPILVRERFPLAMTMIFRHVRFLFAMLKKEWRYVWFMFQRLFLLLLALLIPIALLVAGVINADMILFERPRQSESTSTIGFVSRGLLDLFMSLGGLILSYFLARLVAWLQLKEPDSLESPGEALLKSGAYRFVTMGHTHTPNLFGIEGGIFYNSGTWIPIVQSSSANLRSDRDYILLRFRRDRTTGELLPGSLHCWNDSAERVDPLAVVRRD